MDFYNNKNSRELMKAIDQGTDFNSLLQLILFNTSLIVLNLFIAVVYLSHTFNTYVALDVAIVAVLYIYISLRGNS